MNLLSITCEKPISSVCGLRYKDIAFDGCYFYLTCPQLCQIIKYDLCFHEVKCFKNTRAYTCICYDPMQNCFWAATNKDEYKLFQLDLCFKEIGCVVVYPCENCGTVMTGLSYDCCKNQILVAFTSCILSVNTKDPKSCTVLQKSCATCNLGVLSAAPSYIVIEMQNSRQYLAVYNGASKLKDRLELSNEYFAEGIVLNPCEVHGKEEPLFYLLVTKKTGCSYLLEVQMDCEDLDLSTCNFCLCSKDCHEPCPPPHPHPVPPCPNPCDDLIESIALIETALAHILNAEGEKLQKIIASTNNVEKILEANREINKTIVNVTHLEIILHDKLAAVKDCRCGCECARECECECISS